MRIYEHREISEEHEYEVWYVDIVCTKRVNKDKPDYLEWIAAGNTPEVIPYVPPPPLPPLPPPEIYYNPSKIIRALDAMGQADALEAALLAAPARQRLLWQKEPRFNGDDTDFTDLVDIFQVKLGLTDEQRKAFLAACEED